METLAIEISEILNITAEKAIELMPVIRGQYIRYTMLNKIGGINLFLLTLSIIASSILTFLWVSRHEPEDTPEEEGLWRRRVWSVNILTFVLFTIQALINLLQVILSPDFMIIKEFLIN